MEERKKENKKKERRKTREKKLTAMTGTVDNSFELFDRNKIYTLRYQ